jgi:hypothetical protein
LNPPAGSGQNPLNLLNPSREAAPRTLLSSVAYGATCWPGFKVFALCAGYAHIIARLRNPLQDFCLWKEALALRHAAMETQRLVP